MQCRKIKRAGIVIFHPVLYPPTFLLVRFRDWSVVTFSVYGRLNLSKKWRHPRVVPFIHFIKKKFLWFQTQTHHLSLVLKYVAGRCLWYLCSDLSKGKIHEVSSSLQQFIRQVFITSGHLVAVHRDRLIFFRLNFPVRAEDASSLNHAFFQKLTLWEWPAVFG